MESTNDTISLTRDCIAELIPSGEKIVLIKGEKVKITQALGGTYTLYINGNLAKLAGKDADAIGKPVELPDEDAHHDAGIDVEEELVWEKLKMVYDPEIPVNIVDLGLVYDLRLTPEPGGGYAVLVKMTLTAPGCGMGPSIAADAEYKVGLLPGIKNVKVELVWEPLWNRDMMTDAAKLQLGML
ncbi:MAG: putative Fe-S cluster assembly protein SufT [FCB group bacterium]|nr:putative Fe-S cluster assembly protein SufT [FCB group bacterium]